MVGRGGNKSRDCSERIGREPRREGKVVLKVKPIDYHSWKREADQTLSWQVLHLL